MRREAKEAWKSRVQAHPQLSKEQNYLALHEAIRKNPELGEVLPWRREEDIPWTPYKERAKFDISAWVECLSLASKPGELY